VTDTKRKQLIALVFVLFAAVGVTQHFIDPVQLKLARKAQPKGGGPHSELMVRLPGQFLVAAAAGFKEVVAGVLWARADGFFHEGEYHSIVPIVRMVTWLDPHNVEAFTTGAWHLDYNFVDSNSMSDKRYIPSAIALLREGIANNPDIWDIYFELGFAHYAYKLQDHDEALRLMEEACKRDGIDPNTGVRIPRPQFVDNMLAHQYERVGKLDEAVAQWKKARARAVALLRKERGSVSNDQSIIDTCDRNLCMLYLRRGWRYGDMYSYRKGVEMLKESRVNGRPAFLDWARDAAIRDYQQRVASNNPPHDALKPIDCGFEVSWRRIRPRVIEIKGKVNLVPISEYKDLAVECFTRKYQKSTTGDPARRKQWEDAAKVYWRFSDADYKMKIPDSFSWKLDLSQTVQGGAAMEGIYVSGGQFRYEIDLSNPKDREYYPLKSDKYRLVIWMTPIYPGMTEDIQDRVGWRGEAIWDKNYLDTTTRPGFKMLRKEFIIDRKDII